MPSPETYTGVNTTWTCPSGVVTAQIECWGAGAAGENAYWYSIGKTGYYHTGYSGGGGAYSKNTMYVVVPLTVYTVHASGGDIYFDNATTGVMAKSAVAESAGTAAASVGVVKYSGGNGASSNDGQADTDRFRVGQGGGSSAGTGSNGSAGANSVGTTFFQENVIWSYSSPIYAGGNAPTGGAKGGDGSGYLRTGVGKSTVYTPYACTGGNTPGGGGGGGGPYNNNATIAQAGSGAPGRIVITYGASSAPAFNQNLLMMVGMR